MMRTTDRGPRTTARPPARPGPLRLGAEAGRLALALVLAVAIGACSTAFDPYAEGPPYFVLDATIDSRDDTLFVRVQDFRIPPGALAEPLDARVTLETLSTGEAAVLHDSLTLLNEGTTGHLFWTTASIEGGQTYRLRAARDGDASASSVAEFSIPTPIVADTSVTEESASRRLDFNGLLALPAPVFVTYDVRRADTGQTASVTVSYPPFNQRNSILVTLSADAIRIRTALGLPEEDPQRRAVVTDARVTYSARSPEPIQVKDGRGDVIWRAVLTADWRIPTEALNAVELQDGQGS